MEPIHNSFSGALNHLHFEVDIRYCNVKDKLFELLLLGSSGVKMP